MRIIVFIFVFCGHFLMAQHSPIQSQYMFNPIALNPATAGNEDALSIQTSLRAQWTGFPGAPMTQNLSAHAPLKNENTALGLQLYSDQIGINRNTGLFGIYAYKLRFTNSSLSIGLSTGINFLKSYYSRLDVIDNQDELLFEDSPLGILPDASFGLHYSANKYFITFAIPQFLSHSFNGTKFQLSNDFSNYNYTLGAGYLHEFNNGLSLTPSFLTKYRVGLPPQVDINLMARFNEGITAGLSYRTQEALVALFQVNFSNQFSFMYSFGLPVNQFISYTYGSHEIGFKYNFLYKTKISNPRFLGW
ncbi:MAG: PorP/SprF family type IX secretion system membrane protein [Crocinitomicaceae bacterium]|nr:PorP/SprF family type IX secretion system membrane protein [Crocinitomicaceae bacterium]